MKNAHDYSLLRNKTLIQTIGLGFTLGGSTLSYVLTDNAVFGFLVGLIVFLHLLAIVARSKEV